MSYDQITADLLKENEDLQERLTLSQLEIKNLRDAINRIEVEYDYTLDDDFNAALKDAMTLTYPTLDDLNAYVKSEIDRILGETVAEIVDIKDQDGYLHREAELLEAGWKLPVGTKLYAKKG